MGKAPKLYWKVDPGDSYKYAEIQILEDEYASIGVDLVDGGLTVWSQGARTDSVPVSAKKVRKFARALLALADQVDPPAPKVKYYAATWDLFYRESPGEHLEIWVTHPDGEWVPSMFATIAEQQRDNGDGDSWPITASELPAGAAA